MSLHNEIMNIPTKHDNRDGAIAYKTGHRDARHAAAELALKYENYIEALEKLGRCVLAEGMINQIKKDAGL